MEKQPIKLGIIGAGLAVKLLHWPALKALEGCFEITAVADIVPENVEEIAKMGEELNAAQGFGSEKVRRYSDYRELLREPNEAVEAVLLSLPIHLTAQILQDSWQAGKHIIAEKPIAANLEQGRQLVKAISGNGPIVEIAENYHYREDIKKVQEWMKGGAIGEVFLITLQALFWSDRTKGFASTPWRQDIQYRGGVFTDGGVHHAALLRELGGEVEQLQAFTKLVDPTMAGMDTVIMNMRYRSGVLGHLTFAGATRPPTPDYANIAVYGTEGTITVIKDETRLFRPGQPDETYKPEHSDYYWEFHNFYQAVRHGEPVVATPAEALKDLELVMLAFDSSELRQVILM